MAESLVNLKRNCSECDVGWGNLLQDHHTPAESKAEDEFEAAQSNSPSQPSAASRWRWSGSGSFFI